MNNDNKKAELISNDLSIDLIMSIRHSDSTPNSLKAQKPSKNLALFINRWTRISACVCACDKSLDCNWKTSK